MFIKLVMPSNHLILCRLLLLLPSIFPSIRVFSSESVLRIRWPKYWSFSFSISPSNEYSGLISFRMDWLDLLVISSPSRQILLLLAEGSEAEAGFFFVKEDMNVYGRMLETYESKWRPPGHSQRNWKGAEDVISLSEWFSLCVESWNTT